MTKTDFIKNYGARDTVVRFKNTDEIDAFLKQCESFGIKWYQGQLATNYKGNGYHRVDTISIHEGDYIAWRTYRNKVNYESIVVSPKQMLKDGWYGLRGGGEKVYFLPSIDKYCTGDSNSFPLLNYDNNLTFDETTNSKNFYEIFDTDGVSRWKREIPKSAHDLEIERIEAEMKAQAEITKKLADDLAKLKGLPY